MRAGKWLLVLFSILLVVSGCQSGSASDQKPTNDKQSPSLNNNSDNTLTVFAAAHLTEAFKDMKKAFEDQTGADVTLNFAGTQTLRTQIEQGAPADVFAAANIKHMKAVKKQGLVNNYQKFAYNTLALIVPKENPADIEAFQDIANKKNRLVIGVSDVPVGTYARKMLENANKMYGSDFKKNTLGHVVSKETNVKKVTEKVVLAEADAGITYATDLTPSVEKKVKEMAIPQKLNVTAKDTIAVVSDRPQQELARKWVDFVLSDKGQQILADHHLIQRDAKS